MAAAWLARSLIRHYRRLAIGGNQPVERLDRDKGSCSKFDDIEFGQNIAVEFRPPDISQIGARARDVRQCWSE
jgi:hypothetical protein